MGKLRRTDMNLLEADPETIRHAVVNGQLIVAVYGLGHVGAVVAAAFLKAGASVIGVDVDPEKLELAAQGVPPIAGEPGVDEAFSEGIRSGSLYVTSDGIEASRESNVKIITVPVTLSDKGRADLRVLREVAADIGRGLNRGDLVIVETSVPPGTTETLVLPVLEEHSGMSVERDFGLAYSPERILEGRALKDLTENYPKIVGGVGPRSLRAAEGLYTAICRRGVLKVSSVRVAEAEKIFEGIYRDVNIALANELARLARALDIDFEEAARAANTNPYCHLHRPGVGVGGACIPVYPYFALETAASLGLDLTLTRTARRINEEMPLETIKLIRSLMERLGLQPERVKVAVLGLAFRGDVADSRNSPTYEVVKGLKALGTAEIYVHDPLIAEDPLLEELGVQLTGSLEEAVKGASVVILCTDHSEYKRLKSSSLRDLAGLDKVAIVDGRDVLEPPSQGEEGIVYVGIGRPLVKSKTKNTV